MNSKKDNKKSITSRNNIIHVFHDIKFLQKCTLILYYFTFKEINTCKIDFYCHFLQKGHGLIKRRKLSKY